MKSRHVIYGWRRLREIALILVFLSGLSPFAHALYFAEEFQPWLAAEGREGNFYTCLPDGGRPRGSMCQFTRAGTVRRFHPFPGVYVGGQPNVLGTYPTGRVSVGQEGAIYGSTLYGGVFGRGVVFRLEPRGAYTALHHFEVGGGYVGPSFAASNGDVFSTTGYEPQKMVHLHRDGRRAYSTVPGTAALFIENADHEAIVATYHYQPGPNPYYGKLWRLTPDDQFVAFADLDGLPRHMILLKDGSFVCAAGDKIVQVSSSGQVATLHQFTTPSEGLSPIFLVVAKDGNYYGNTAEGGLENSGTVFRIASDTLEFTVLSHLHRAGPLGPGVVWVKSVLPFWAAASAGNIPPRAHDDFVDAASLRPGAPGGLPSRVVSVLRNDSDANRNPLTVVSVSTPAHGEAAFDFVRQKITYTATAADIENDAFSYTIVDGNGGSATAQVIIRTAAAGAYLGDVSSPPNATTGDPGSVAGTLSVRVTAARTYTARLDLLGRVYRFVGRFNDWNTSGAVLASNWRLGTSLGISLWLRPNGADWTVEATIHNGTPPPYSPPYSASCVAAP
jgi:uncharacterized repeat protein (TIGR03803 family)